jgi:hypothetical protein
VSPQAVEEEVKLCAGEQRVVHLRVVPLSPGLLHAHGLTWVLNGVAHGQTAFCFTRPRKLGSSNK